MITYKFILKSQSNKDGLYPIYLRAYLKTKKIEIATQIVVKASDWSIFKQRIKSSNKNHSKYNEILNAYDKRAMKCILTHYVNNITPLSLYSFKNYMSAEKQYYMNFTDYILNYLQTNQPHLSSESFRTYKSQVSKLLKFKTNICFADISEDFIIDYRNYMINTLGNCENTVGKSLRTLRTFINLAVRYGYIKSNPFKYITIRKTKGKRAFLSIEELNAISHAYYHGTLNPQEQKVLRYFLFACYTGLRYTDITNLECSDILNNCISLKMHKTHEIVSIPLSNKAIELLPPITSGKVFRTYCNFTTNRILKQICTSYKIPKEVTFHVARHTFATISICLGMPIEVISKLLGHTSIQTTQVYAKIVDNVKLREMSKWDQI